MRAPLKPIQKLVCTALVAASFLAIPAARADWSNFGTVSMTDAVTPKLTNGYLCYSDGRDIACNTSVGPVLVGTSGMINNGGMTVAGSVSASAVSATYVSATVLQINPSTMPCSTGLNGTIRYSSVSSTLEVCAGTNWTTLSSNTAPGNLSGTGSATAVAFWSGPSSLTYESATTSGLYWDSANGRLGVGTNSPVVGLTISSTSGLAFDSAAAKSISWYTGGGYPVQIRGDASNVYLAFLLGGREAARFNTAGNLGLGTQSPTATLQVSGTFTVSNSQAPTSPSFVVGLNGNVGIGVANPMQQNGLHLSDALGYGFIGSPNDMHLEGNAYYDGTNWRYMVAKPAMMMAIGPGTNGASFWSAPAGTANAVISFPTTPTLRINPSGSVAVGTYANTSSFTVVGEVQVSSSGGPCATATNGGAIRYSAGTLSYCNGANTWTALAASGVTNPGGATTNVQYNNNGALGGDAGFTYVSGTGSVSVSGALYSHDANAYFYNNGTTPALVFDANDYLQYIRATNTLAMYIGGVQLVSLSSAGYLDVAGRVSSTLFYGGDGTVGAPTYSFSNDTNSGFYRPASNVIGVSIGSSEVARFTAGGLSLPGTVSASSVSATNVSGTNIQVGQSALACAAGINGAIRYNTTSNTLQICVGTIWTSLASGTTGGTLTGGGSATAVAFWNGPSSITYDGGLYWDNTGKRLGIGTTTPSTTLHLYGVGASGNVALRMTGSGPMGEGEAWGENALYQQYLGGPLLGRTYWLGHSNGRPDFVIETRGVSNALVVNGGSGTVGIGTFSPTATLQVSGTFTVSTSAQTSTSPSFDVGSNGNVGIGQKAPAAARLKVYGDAVVQGDSSNANLYLQNAANTQTWLLANGGNFSIWDSTAGKGPFIIEPASPNYSFYVKNTGSIGIGTNTPTSSLTIVGEAQVGSSGAACVTATNGGAIRYSAGTLYYCNGANTWATIGSGGGTLTGGGSATAVAFWNGPNSLTYESATTSGLYWDHTNSRLGIGTNAPTDAIMVSESGTPTIRMRGATGGFVALERNYGTSNFTVGDNIGGMVFSGLSTPQLSGSAAAVKGWFDAAGGTRYKGRLTLETSDGNNIVERMRVDSDGNVGIGMQSATATLQVSGTFTVSNSAQGATSPSIFVSATNGYVGIGTMSPDVPLTVAGATSGSLLHLIRTNSSFNSNIRYESGAGSLYAGAYGLDFRIGMNSDLGISPVAVFTPSNSVGIGTGNGAVPSSLTVVGEAQVGSSGAACVTATNGGAIRYSAGALYYCNGANTWATIGTGGGTLTGGGSATAIAFWNGASSLTYESATTSSLYWDHGNGRLGIGTNTPNEALDVSTTQGRAFFGATVTGGRAGLLINGYSPGGPYARLESYNYGISSGIPLLINAVGNGPVGVGALSPTAALQVSGTFTVSQSWQNTASAASMLVDSRGVSVSSIVHINGSAFSPIGAGGNAILSGTTAVSTSSAGSITMYTGGNLAFAVNNNGRVGIKQEPNSFPLAVSGTIFTGRNNTTIEGGEIDLAYPENNGSTNNSMWITDVYGSASSPSYRIFNKSSAGSVVNAVTINNDGTVWVGAASSYPSTQISPNGGIGFNTNASANGYWYAGFYRSGTAIGSISQNGTTAIAYNTTSDRRVKENIIDTREGLQKLMRLPVRDFAFRADPSHTIVTGFIAQELDKVFPEAVTTNGDNGETPLKDKSKPWSVDYGRITPLIVKAVQDLKRESDTQYAEFKAANDNLVNETAALKVENASLKSANDNMARRLDALERKVAGSR